MAVNQARQKSNEWPYIEFDDEGRPIISGTRLRVSFLIQEKRTYGWSPEEIYFQHPELSLAQIHAALGYYYSHQTEIEREIEKEAQTIESLKNELKDSGLVIEANDLKEKLKKRAA